MERSASRTDTKGTGPTESGDQKALVVYYSRTGTTESVAEKIANQLPDPDVARIRPRRERRYLSWLVRSAIPGSTVAIHPVSADLSAYDAVFLGSPKWTLSCPPVNAYLEDADLQGKTVGLFVTYGGFDEERFTRSLADRLRSRGCAVPATLLVKRDRANGDHLEDRVNRFVREVLG
ncbi:MAG: flavodoxin family protein [Halodesulfurarchaeum sp.]